MIKYIVAILLIGATVSASVRNTGTTTRDSVPIYVVCLDSLGKMSTCDSFYVRVIKSGTNAVVFSDSGTLSMTGMDSISGKSEYYYHRAVADIDGSGDDGEYILTVIAKKTAGSGWPTPNSRIFEIQNKLVFSQMKIVSTDDTAVVFATSANGKPAWTVRSTNATSGYGLYISSKSSDAAVFDALGSGAVYGLKAQSAGATGGGAIFDGSSGGNYGAVFTGGAGSVIFGGVNNTADFGGSATFNGAYIDALTNPQGTVRLRVDSTSNAAWFKTTGLSAVYADSTFNGRLLYVKYSTRTNPRIAGEVSRIYKYDSIGTTKSDVIYVYPPFSQAPAVGDTIVMFPFYSTSPTMVKDTIGTITVGDVTLAASQPNYAPVKVGDTDELRNNIVTALGIPLKPSDTDELRNNIVTALGIPLKPSDTDELRANIAAAIGTPLKPSDTDELRANIVAAMPVPLQPSDTDKLNTNIRKGILGDTSKRVFSGILNDTTKRIKFSNDSVVAIDPVRTVAATVAGMATATALAVAQDSINAISTWLKPSLDSILYASGFKIGSRSTQGVSADCDTLHVKIGTTPWFKMLFYHVGGTAGARPDSTITVAP